MTMHLYRTSFLGVLLVTCFSMTGFAEKSYLPEALKTVEQIKSQQGKIDGYRASQYVPVIPGVDIPKASQSYELPKHLTPYELQTSHGTVQFYKLPKLPDVPQTASFLPQLPEVSQEEISSSVSAEVTDSSGKVAVGSDKANISSVSKAVAPASPNSSAPQTNQPADSKKKIGFWGF